MRRFDGQIRTLAELKRWTEDRVSTLLTRLASLELSKDGTELVVKVAGTEVARFTEDGISTAARGQLDYAEVTANQGGITSTETDLTGLTVTVDVPASRRIRVTGVIHMISSVAGDDVRMRVYEDTTIVQEVDIEASAVVGDTMIGMAVLSPDSGQHTYKLTLDRLAGSGTLTSAAGSSNPAFILIEDIGPA